MTAKKKVLITGCSFTRGHGLEHGIKDRKLWVNRLFPEEIYTVTNVAKTGANNDWIFLETVSQMLTGDYDIVVVAWTAIPRFNFHVGLELYSVETLLQTGPDINLVNGCVITGKWLKAIGDNLRFIHNDHWDLLNMVKYVNTLLKIQKTNQGKIFFINALGPWSDQYFKQKCPTVPNDLDTYTQKLLQVDQRDDQEIFDLYQMIHTQYQTYGGIQEQSWLNLYESLDHLKIDTISKTDLHPGYHSQDRYVERLAPILSRKLMPQ
jgi:hypothetical protein